MQVHATARDVKAATSLVALAAAHPSRLTVHEVDFTSAPSLTTLAAAMPQFDRLIVNAAQCTTFNSSLTDTNEDAVPHLLAMFDTNVVAPIKTVLALAPQLRQGGKVVLISSHVGCITTATQAASMPAAYAVSKVSRRNDVEACRVPAAPVD